MQKYIIILWFALYSISAGAQAISTVCIGSIRNYKVTGGPGSVYNWHINGGTIISDPIKDSVIVKWGNIGGIYEMYVIETNIYGCIGDTIFHQVIVNPLLPVAISGPDEICNGEGVTLTAVNSLASKWSTGSTNQSITVYPSANTTYRLIGTTSCSIDTVYKYISVHPKPQSDFIYSPYQPVEGEIINFTYTGSPVNTYKWYNDLNLQFSNQTNPSYTIQNNNATLISLCVSNQFGCCDSISKTIFTNGDVYISIPNCFTPDGDGLNDVFKVVSASEVKDFSLYIYNRWGQLVFESKNINVGWDGKFLGSDAPQGVYNWTLTYQSVKNTKIINRKAGQITVLR
jgi:gliding motility-associated-like protein